VKGPLESAITQGITEGAKLIRKPEEHRTEIEASSMKVGSFSKAMVWLILGLAFMAGIAFIVLAELTKAFSWRTVKEYVGFMRVFGATFVPVMLMVGIGRAFKHSKWSKDI
jgi:hypothetical protein